MQDDANLAECDLEEIVNVGCVVGKLDVDTAEPGLNMIRLD